MGALSTVAATFKMTDESWKRHANPWSVWTRFAAIPLMLLAIWSRDWLGWWCLAPIAVVMVWLWLNPRAFPPVEEPTSWAAKGIYGEKMWLADRSLVTGDHRGVQRLLVGLGVVALALIAWGLVALQVWPTVFGATLLIVGQLWRIDRLGRLYEQSAEG
ncbi:hypothetical protein Afil01_40580 [Actinorhabdospora filicis]|uniref:Uncharacterized protein n=1 Tax=Actinorhabdospora filicis TaxID=1785913 RepID=A0A9W6WB60_9ACTN|nr:DUF6653 family protein [Actinorhabdospora filicis]GLZ79251.1 hypothetical protein Afil01_40580 [Actinorhabdospora filicis]